MDYSFLGEFDTSMERLATTTNKITDIIAQRAKFSSETLAKLQKINATILNFNEQIKQLRLQITTLTNNATTNASSIQNTSGEIDNLRAQINDLTAQNSAIQTELNECRTQATTENGRLNSELVNATSRIAELTAQNEALANQVAELTDTLRNNGEQSAQSAAEINRHAEEERLRIENMQAQNAAEIQKLTDAINQCNAEKLALQQNLDRANSELGQKMDANNSELEESKKTVANLIGLNNKLSEENVDLINRIKRATSAIMSAVGKVDELENSSSQTDVDIDNLIEQINQSLGLISASLQGRNQPGNEGSGIFGNIFPEVPTNPPTIPAEQSPPQTENTPASARTNFLSTFVTINGTKIAISKILENLREKLKTHPSDSDASKYATAIRNIQGVNYSATHEKVNNLINRLLEGINILDTSKGGKKTKKLRRRRATNKITKKNKRVRRNRKVTHKRAQKGGFIYTNTKRRSISSSSNSQSKRHKRTTSITV